MAKEEFEKLMTEVRETSNQLVEALDRSTKNKKADLFEILFRRSAFLFFFLHSVNFYYIISAITAGIFGLTAIKIRIRSTTVIIVIDHFT